MSRIPRPPGVRLSVAGAGIGLYGPIGVRAINATPIRLVGLVAICLAAGSLGGVSGALLVGRNNEQAPRAAPPVATPTPDASERLRESLPGAAQGVVTILVDLPNTTNGQGQVIETRHFGSGVVLANGVILTNQHVVEGAVRVRVILPTGEEREAVQLADDAPFQDVALIQTNGRGLRPARLGTSSSVGLGDPVAVVASGIVSYQNQVKVGVISGLGLDFPRDGIVLSGMLQTDAAVNNGDSGGALVNASGEVIGVVTSVVRSNANGQPVEGVAMVHAIDDLKPFIDAVVANGVNPRGRIGIERVGRQHLALDSEVAQALGVPLTAGLEASTAMMTAVAGQPVDGGAPFANLLGVMPPGTRVTLTVWRAGETFETNVLPRPVRAVLRSPS
jgi:S1-C subfamily serine protease